MYACIDKKNMYVTGLLWIDDASSWTEIMLIVGLSCISLSPLTCLH